MILAIVTIFAIFLSNIENIKVLDAEFSNKYSEEKLESNKILNSAKTKTINETINGEFISEQDKNIGNHYVN